MRKWMILSSLLGVVLLIAGLVISLAPDRVSAAESSFLATTLAQADEETGDVPRPSNDYCLLCHSKPDRIWNLPSGEQLSLEVDPQILAESVHGDANPDGPLACADCHIDHRFPHPTQTIQTVRDFQIERFASCRTCHEDEYTHAQDSIHGIALREGKIEAALCVDCHGGHNIQTPDEPRQRISFTCGECHGAIFDQYKDSVHGAALLDEGNPDVPTCVDCHGVHDIEDPTTISYRVRSPQVCAECHADEDLMNRYEISTNVFDSYLTDFHGTTVALFEQQDVDVATNKAVCYDCHGVHDIRSVDSEGSNVIRDNLLTTCQQCHPGATANFSDAWLGHYTPTIDSNPLLFVVNAFYTVLIPSVVGAFVLLIFTDIVRRLRHWLGRSQESGGS